LVQVLITNTTDELLHSNPSKHHVPVLGLLSVRQLNISKSGAGRIAVFGDTSCVDNAHQRQPCYWLLRSILTYTSHGLIDDTVFGVPTASSQHLIGKDGSSVALLHLDHSPYKSSHLFPPSRLHNTDNDLSKFSKVKGPHGFYPLTCHPISFSPIPIADNPIVIPWKAIHKQGVTPHTPRDTGSVQDNVNSYLLPYVIVCVAVVALVLMAIRSRKDRLLTKRISV